MENKHKRLKLYHTHCSRSPPSMDRCASPITFLSCHCEQCYRAGDGRHGCRLERNGIQNVKIVPKSCPTAQNASQLVWFCKYTVYIQHSIKCIFLNIQSCSSKPTYMVFLCFLDRYLGWVLHKKHFMNHQKPDF